MHYEINVCFQGVHYFATAERSLRDEKEARAMWEHFRKLFKAEQGFTMTITLYERIGKRLNWS